MHVASNGSTCLARSHEMGVEGCAGRNLWSGNARLPDVNPVRSNVDRWSGMIWRREGGGRLISIESIPFPRAGARPSDVFSNNSAGRCYKGIASGNRNTGYRIATASLWSRSAIAPRFPRLRPRANSPADGFHRRIERRNVLIDVQIGHASRYTPRMLGNWRRNRPERLDFSSPCESAVQSDGCSTVRAVVYELGAIRCARDNSAIVIKRFHRSR